MKKRIAFIVAGLFLAISLMSCGRGSSPSSAYTVIYNGNGYTGGSAPADPNTYTQGQTVTVLANNGNLVNTTTPGCTFAGWNTAADGSGTTYTGGQVFTMGAADVTLYAKWTSNPTYTVVYNSNRATGGSVPIDPNTYTQGQVVTVLGNNGNLVMANYAFAGWNTAADGSGTAYPAGQIFTIGAAAVTLYAQWTANPTYNVIYDDNWATGGSVPVDQNNYQQGQVVTVLGNNGNLTKTGYTFAGWNTADDGSGTTYAQSQTFTMGAANVTLYAKWTANPTYTVTYNGNGATGGIVPVDSTNYEQGQPVTVIGNNGNLARTYYTFIGWNTNADGSGAAYAGGQQFTMGAANVTLYAKWTAIPTYTVTYNGNGATGGSVPVDPNNYEQGQTVTVLGNTGNLTKTGYEFGGWNTAADGSGTTQGQQFTMGPASVTLYAVWRLPNVLTVLHSFGAGTDGQNPQAGLIMDSAGNLYGTTSGGGAYGPGAFPGGTVFKLDTSGNETALYSLVEVGTQGPYNGVYPRAGLVMDGAGILYGTTYDGGAYYYGTVFKIDTSGNETVLHNFNVTDGASPQAGLIMDSAGNLYGTTNGGGANGDGTVFKIDTSGNETVLHSFNLTDGAGPQAGLIMDGAGSLYGTTYDGGAYSQGTVFKLDTSGNETVLYSFGAGTDGQYPMAGLTMDSAGNLYGTTAYGGAYNYGTAFKLAP